MNQATLAPLTYDETMLEAAHASKAWPFEEARKVLKRLEKDGKDGPVLFETGYGPSGLPHIGTFGEVARTTMVRNAFRLLTEDKTPTRLIAFSDDMDGLRKVPENVPRKDMLSAYIGKPLTKVPSPFDGDHESFAHHNNARLCSFLDQFGFDYEFMSSSEVYASGRFDEALLRMLEIYDTIMEIILPTLGPERRATYSPFLPICPRTGNVLQVPMRERNVKSGTVIYDDPETGEATEVPVTGGRVKCQWKADWAMRWFALGIDYEMAGKDLIDSVALSGKICRALGRMPPEGFNYELFLDEKGEKISKSIGNGVAVEEWLSYASPESLALFMYQKPRSAKRLFFDVIPKAVDEYFTFQAKYLDEPAERKIVNPVWHIHEGSPPRDDMPISFNMLLNLVSASNSQEASLLWCFISRYAPGANPQSHPKLDELVGYAIDYYHAFIAPTKAFRSANEKEAAAITDLEQRLSDVDPSSDGEALQTLVYDVGKTHEFENLRDWFSALYQVLLGQSQGPRFGSFIALYGIEESRQLMKKALLGELVDPA